MRTKHYRQLTGLLAIQLLAGCAMGPDFQSPNPASPATWFSLAAKRATKVSVPVAAPLQPRWWETFGDPKLTKIVLRVADSNLDVRAAAARLEESRAQLGVTSAQQYPTLNGNGSYTRELISKKGVIGLLGNSGGSTATQSNGLGGRQGGVPSGAAGGGGLPPFDLWQYGFDASWELDLWGKVRRMTENAAATAQASEDARHDILLSSMAEVARDYLQLRGVQAQLQVTRENLASTQRSLGLTNDRYHRGLSSDLDVASLQSQVEDTAAQIPNQEQQAQKLINAIGLLLGEYPGALAAELAAPAPIPGVPPTVPIGLPSELTRRRPDVREAEAQLHAATASIGAAQADFFPTVTLSGSLSLQALQLKDLNHWGSRTFGLGPSVSLPIFEGGRLRGTLALRKAQQQEAAANYQRTVLAAFRDVDDAMTGYAAEQRRHIRLAASVTVSRRALDLAQTRYSQGLTDYLQVLTAQRSLLSAQQQLTDSTATIATNLVALYKALGGGWDPVGENAMRRAVPITVTPAGSHDVTRGLAPPAAGRGPG